MDRSGQPRPNLPGAHAATEQLGSRLDSWKEIASYLGRSEKTVQRWEEREELPVHRLVHEKRGSVYAYTSELDAWREVRKAAVESNASSSEPALVQETDAGDARPPTNTVRLPFQRRLLRLFIVSALLIISEVGWFTWHRMAVLQGSARVERVRSLAALPLENLSKDPEQEYFTMG